MTQQPSSQPPKQYQHSDIQEEMPRKPQTEASEYRASGKLQGKVALITGGIVGLAKPLLLPSPRKGPTWPSFT